MANTKDPYGDLLKEAKNKNVEGLMNRLNPADREKVQNILNNPEETKKLLANPKVQELIRKLKNNG